MKRKTILWAVVFIVIAGACAGFYAFRDTTAGTLADIYVDGELRKTVSLSENCTFTINSEYGYNTITVEDGTIRVDEADCDEQTCVRQGAVKSPLVPIVCLPHRLVIEIRETQP